MTPCSFCGGADTDCQHCQGTNVMPFFRCPNKLVTQREIDAVAAVARVEIGILPDAGGWTDQAHTFVSSYPLIAQEIERWREKIAEKQRRKAQEQQRRRGR